MYRIDVPTYHWDNDRFEIETKTLTFPHLWRAERFQGWLRSLQFEADSLLCRWSVPVLVRDKQTHEIPHHNSEARVEGYDRVDVYHGVIIEASFDIYTEKVIRTKIGT